MKTRKLWISFILVMTISFAVLIYYGREIYRQAPPIPDKVMTADGKVLFTGQDIKDGQNVWQSVEFNKYAKDNYVLYRADFPKKKANQLPEVLRKQNLALAEKYNEDGNYPLVLLLDSDGKVLGVLGYLDLEASEYIDRIKELDKNK